MASLDFPSSPTNGQTYSSAGVTWTYDSTYTVWNVTSSGPVGYSGSQGYTGSKGDIGYSGSLGYTGSKGTDGVIGYNGSVGYTGSKGDIGYTGSLGYTGSGATGVNWTNKSATYTAVNTDGIIADTSGGSFTVTLPASPATGSYVVFIDGGNSFQTYPLTVAGNGSTIDGSYTSAVLNITNAKVEFIYSGSTWEMATSTGTRGYTGSLGYTGSVGYTGSLGYSGSGATGVNWTNKSTTYTAVNNDGIIANTSGGSFTVTLPASPSTGSYVVFLDGNSSFATYPLTVDGNGNNIADSYSTATLNITNSKVEFIYNGSTWEIATSTGTRGYSGSVGYTGSLGYTGSAGVGYTGSQGDIGYSGSLGYTGSKGDIGYTGSKGDIGYTGSLGYTGSKGDIGYTGSQGAIGYTGSQGYTGSKGDIGYTGSIPAAITATSLALGGATLGTNNLAVTGTTQLSSSLGIGMSPSNILDITQNQNGASAISILNNNTTASGSARAELYLKNGTNLAILRQYGTAFATSGLDIADSCMLTTNGAGGLTLNTGAAQPIRFAINSTEKARINTAGHLLVGTTSDSGVLSLQQDQNTVTRMQNTNSSNGAAATADMLLYNGTSYVYLSQQGTAYTTSGVTRQDGAILNSVGAGGLTLCTGAGQPIYFAYNNSEKMRLDGNSFLVGKTSSAIATAGFQVNYSTGQTDVTVSGSECMNIARLSSYGSIVRFFQTDGATICGTISTSAGATAYNTSSDYRLKENVQPMTGGLNKIAALKPVTYDWIADQTAGEGFIAHELQAVIPRAVTGEKDDVNEDGSIKPQGVDFGKIVPHLVAAIQELTAQNADLTTRLAALEAK